MYTKRVQIINYGPISQLDLELPFDGDTPKPIVIVGENGTGKSIFLSQIVNGLTIAKGLAYPETPEIDAGRAFKLWSTSYVRHGSAWSHTKVEYERDLFIGDLTASRSKPENDDRNIEFPNTEIERAWNNIKPQEIFSVMTNINTYDKAHLRDRFAKNCALYFPHNRFEEPAWLNENNLKAQAEYMNIDHIQGHTNRRIINYSSLQDNQNWLFELAYDMTAFEKDIRALRIVDQNTNQIIVRSEWRGHRGNSTDVYQVAIDVIQRIMRRIRGVSLRIGGRFDRTISLVRGSTVLVPNLFQLSSGETSLLNLFLSILRDFDQSEASFASAHDVRGIVVVDEVDLHLHAVHQHEILPSLVQMFPNVQFVVTTHSPLFVLGMSKVFGEYGFAIFRMPDGQQVGAEEFSEFGDAYQVFTSSSKFAGDVRLAVRSAQRPILYLEGATDILYLQRAAELLDESAVLQRVDLEDGGGDRLKKVWKAVSDLPEQLVPRRVMVLHDCDYNGGPEDRGHRFRRKIPRQEGHPIKKGIENLFSKATLEKAAIHKPAFIDVAGSHPVTERGQVKEIPEQWTVNEDEKKNLCQWLCQNGTAEDFRHFQVIFDLLSQLIDNHDVK